VDSSSSNYNGCLNSHLITEGSCYIRKSRWHMGPFETNTADSTSTSSYVRSHCSSGALQLLSNWLSDTTLAAAETHIPIQCRVKKIAVNAIWPKNRAFNDQTKNDISVQYSLACYTSALHTARCMVCHLHSMGQEGYLHQDWQCRQTDLQVNTQVRKSKYLWMCRRLMIAAHWLWIKWYSLEHTVCGIMMQGNYTYPGWHE
jgi:hypothetical protein